MGKWFRRIRGVIGMGLLWAIAWGLVGGVPRWIFGIETDVPIPVLLGIFGFFSGVTFAGVLMLTERRRKFEEMTLPRFAGWGATGGVLLSAIVAKPLSLGWGDVLALAPTLAAACAICASGSLALAKRAQLQQLPGAENDSPKSLTG